MSDSVRNQSAWECGECSRTHLKPRPRLRGAGPANETAAVIKPFPRPPRSFFRRGAPTLAKALLGQRLVRLVDGQRLAGRIVETEAYCGVTDQAAHSFNHRRTNRTEPMWSDGGTAYVYFTYGMHHCMNVSASGEGDPQAVLIRALEPTQGVEAMRLHRPKARRDTDLCSGPARLCEALRIDRGFSGVDLLDCEELWIEQIRKSVMRGRDIAVTPRVGVQYAGEWAGKPLRFLIRDHPHCSRPPRSALVGNDRV
jgi:DNA-3-methyladenine glycosylase